MVSPPPLPAADRTCRGVVVRLRDQTAAGPLAQRTLQRFRGLSGAGPYAGPLFDAMDLPWRVGGRRFSGRARDRQTRFDPRRDPSAVFDLGDVGLRSPAFRDRGTLRQRAPRVAG